jgi:hypothetical protein
MLPPSSALHPEDGDSMVLSAMKTSKFAFGVSVRRELRTRDFGTQRDGRIILKWILQKQGVKMRTLLKSFRVKFNGDLQY